MSIAATPCAFWCPAAVSGACRGSWPGEVTHGPALNKLAPRRFLFVRELNALLQATRARATNSPSSCSCPRASSSTGSQPRPAVPAFHLLTASSSLPLLGLPFCRTGKQQYPIFPFVLQSANVFKSEDPFRLINVPDVAPSDIPEGVDFSMAAGDFLESFPDDDDGTKTPLLNLALLHPLSSSMSDVALCLTRATVYDCVATCFFLDTAKNVVDYVETIHRLLKPGGVWVNIGTRPSACDGSVVECHRTLSHTLISRALPS